MFASGVCRLARRSARAATLQGSSRLVHPSRPNDRPITAVISERGSRLFAPEYGVDLLGGDGAAQAVRARPSARPSRGASVSTMAPGPVITSTELPGIEPGQFGVDESALPLGQRRGDHDKTVLGHAGPEDIPTETTTVVGVADRIADTVGLTLVPNTDGRLVGRIRRMAVTVRHIRL